MGIDQWARPWPDRAGRDSRIWTGLQRHISWICWDGGAPVATITADPGEDPHWPEANRAEAAIYVHRLVVSRRYAGIGLGAALLNWAGRTGSREHGARWVRVSAWTTNSDLHAYFRRQGFSLCGYQPDDAYPSGAHFQKPGANIPTARSPLFQQT
jgi:GNAT superfamily N-acetyltransferase